MAGKPVDLPTDFTVNFLYMARLSALTRDDVHVGEVVKRGHLPVDVMRHGRALEVGGALEVTYVHLEHHALWRGDVR